MEDETLDRAWGRLQGSRIRGWIPWRDKKGRSPVGTPEKYEVGPEEFQGVACELHKQALVQEPGSPCLCVRSRDYLQP